MAKSVKDSNGLSDKQALFVKEYLKDLNAKQAAIRVGYSEKTAAVQASRLLTNANVVRAVEEAINQRSERTDIDADYVLKRLVQIDRLDVLDILDNTGNMLPIMEWPIEWRMSISGLDAQEMMSGDISTVIRKIKWPDKLKNLELLGRHFKMFTDKMELGVDEDTASLILAARKRARQS